MNCAKEDKKHTKNQVDVHKCTKLPELCASNPRNIKNQVDGNKLPNSSVQKRYMDFCQFGFHLRLDAQICPNKAHSKYQKGGKFWIDRDGLKSTATSCQILVYTEVHEFHPTRKAHSSR